MSFVHVDASVRTNRKFLRAGPAASWLWLCANAYSQDGLTDGFIPFEALKYLRVENPKPLIPKLVQAGLWDEVEGGWCVHDYLEYNKSAEEIRTLKKRRGDGGKLGGRPTNKPSSETLEVSDKVNLPQNPSTPTASTSASSTATATTRSRPTTLIPRRRWDAAWEGPRVYVPQRAHSDFVALRNHPGAETELLAWYEAVSDEWTTGARRSESPGADMFAFWRARFDERWPAAVAVKDTRPVWARR